ncbi:hypothetical protein SDC9_70356 [bioreactor metagenome]|uniref:Uncharacterized protein n=1 Tax=bioreactor metagenome TaxID=1076179 RepID=A0A644Y6E4_9ZZZZ
MEGEELDVLHSKDQPHPATGYVLPICIQGCMAHQVFTCRPDRHHMGSARTLCHLSGEHIVQLLRTGELHLPIGNGEPGEPSGPSGDDQGAIAAVDYCLGKGRGGTGDRELARQRALGDHRVGSTAAEGGVDPGSRGKDNRVAALIRFLVQLIELGEPLPESEGKQTPTEQRLSLSFFQRDLRICL